MIVFTVQGCLPELLAHDKLVPVGVASSHHRLVLGEVDAVLVQLVSEVILVADGEVGFGHLLGNLEFIISYV